MSSIFMSELGGRVSILLVKIPCITRMMVISVPTASLNSKKMVANVVAISIAEGTYVVSISRNAFLSILSTILTPASFSRRRSNFRLFMTNSSSPVSFGTNSSNKAVVSARGSVKHWLLLATRSQVAYLGLLIKTSAQLRH